MGEDSFFIWRSLPASMRWGIDVTCPTKMTIVGKLPIFCIGDISSWTWLFFPFVILVFRGVIRLGGLGTEFLHVDVYEWNNPFISFFYFFLFYKSHHFARSTFICLAMLQRRLVWSAPHLKLFFRCCRTKAGCCSSFLSRWGFQTFVIFTPTWGNDPIWRAYFSDGLVQPPTSCGLYLPTSSAHCSSIIRRWSTTPVVELKKRLKLIYDIYIYATSE